MSRRGETIHDVVLVLHGETERAWRCSQYGESESCFFLPKSQVEREESSGECTDRGKSVSSRFQSGCASRREYSTR